MIKTGIYIIINNISNKYYIGQASNISKRWIDHKYKLNKQKDHCRHLQAAWNKYGASCFSFVLLEECKKDIAVLKEAEQYWMDYFKFIGAILYNSCSVSFSPLGYRHTEQARKNMSFAMKGRIAHNKGKKMSEEARHKMSLAKLGRSLSTETKNKMSASAMGKRKSEEHKQNISIGKRGISPSLEHRIKISNTLKNKKGKNNAK